MVGPCVSVYLTQGQQAGLPAFFTPVPTPPSAQNRTWQSSLRGRDTETQPLPTPAEPAFCGAR